MKYTVTWTRPYQGPGVSTAASETYDSAAGAYRKLVDVQCEPECSNPIVVSANGTRVSKGHLRAWATPRKTLQS